MRISDYLDKRYGSYIMSSELEISGHDLSVLLPAIKQCDEFALVSSLTQLWSPHEKVLVDGEPTILASFSYKLPSPDQLGVLYTHDCWIYSIQTSPVIYDAMTFEPKRNLFIRGVMNRMPFIKEQLIETSIVSDWLNKWKS